MQIERLKTCQRYREQSGAVCSFVLLWNEFISINDYYADNVYQQKSPRIILSFKLPRVVKTQFLNHCVVCVKTKPVPVL